MKRRGLLEENPFILLKSYLISLSFNAQLRDRPGRNPCGEIGPGWYWYFTEIVGSEGVQWYAKYKDPGIPFQSFLRNRKSKCI